VFLEDLRVVNFRNLKNVQLKFFDKNIFYGENAQGKTNLLESIYFLFTGKSFRTPYEKELINWNEESFYIKGNVLWQDQKLILETALSKTDKKVKINQKLLKRQKDMIFLFPVVVFSQEEIESFKEGPSERRYILDRFISTLSYKYHKSLSEYYKVLYQRNLTLKSDGNVDIWNSSLIKSGTYILIERLKIINKLRQLIHSLSLDLLGKDFLEIEYYSSINLGNMDEENLMKNFELKLKESFEDENKKGYTLVGPHRDDLRFYIKKDSLRYDMRKYASAGERKLAFIIFKLATVKLLSEFRKEKPILIIDDLFGDLDEEKQKLIWNGISMFQIFMSLPVRIDFLKDYPHFLVKNGEVFYND
jgi:DNA replication and repair protein RecF